MNAAVAGTWVNAFLTLGIFSWMYKENPWFRVVENVYIGSALGQLAVTGYQNIRQIAWDPAVKQGRYILFVPLLAGLLLLSRWWDKYAWLSRASMGFLVGTTAALNMTGAIKAQLIEQVTATMMPLTSLKNVIFVVLTIAATIYFLFSVQDKRVTPVINLGKYVLMVGFGATFGNTVMSRISLFTGRMQFLLFEWLKLKH